MYDWNQPEPHARVRVRNRADYDHETIFSILDQGLVAHVGLIMDQRPMVIPMIYARIDDNLYIHGAKATRIIKKPDVDAPACLTVTLVDDIVVARSAFHHSMNYRSAVIHGRVRPVNSRSEKEQALIALTNHALPGRWDEVRSMNNKEFRATGVLALEIESASAKSRSGPPIDDDDDYALPLWAGRIPIQSTLGSPIADEMLGDGVSLPDSVRAAIAGSK